jgi:hypothetical protein
MLNRKDIQTERLNPVIIFFAICTCLFPEVKRKALQTFSHTVLILVGNLKLANKGVQIHEKQGEGQSLVKILSDIWFVT